MPTPSEQKALAFLAIVILLGGAVRIVRAGSSPSPTLEEQQALARQVGAVETAAVQSRSEQKSRRSAKVARGSRDDVSMDRSVHRGRSDREIDRPIDRLSAELPGEGWVNGFPPPSPRIDIDNRAVVAPSPQPGALPRRPARNGRSQLSGGVAQRDSLSLVDLDVATAAEIDALPRVGPTLAARLVANRDSFGPFRSLEGLRRVKGMGPAVTRALAPLVTFSGRAASFTARSRYH